MSRSDYESRKERRRRQHRAAFIAKAFILVVLLALLGVCLLYFYRQLHPA